MPATESKTTTWHRCGGEVLAVVDKPRISSAATLSGYLVRSPRHEDLGCIEELMVDPSTGRIIYAVLSFGGLLGNDGKLYAVPWSALSLDTDQRVFFLDFEREQMETAPQFSEENWPDFADPEWSERIHRHFGLRPHTLAA
jgi:hypothetical protein